MEKVTVTASRTYDILIGDGLIDQVGLLMAERFDRCRAAILTDDRVAPLYARRVAASLEMAGFEPCLYAFPNGEASKTMATLSDMLEFLGAQRMTRGDLVVALGGGVPGDMAGFAASVYARGMRFIQVPTTLLAAVDSSVGGKTAVNLAAGKNMAGVFAQPALVVCDTAVLRALDDALIADGAAEIIKYGVLADRDLFETMRVGALRQKLSQIVKTCVTIKRDIVAADEFDEGARQLLNLGHTLGHAVEKCANYTMTHGHGVAIGMAMIARAARAKGYLEDDSLVASLTEALTVNALPTEPPFGAAELADAALSDKKRRGGRITLVVPRAIGRCELVTVPVDELIGWAEAGVTR